MAVTVTVVTACVKRRYQSKEMSLRMLSTALAQHLRYVKIQEHVFVDVINVHVKKI